MLAPCPGQEANLLDTRLSTVTTVPAAELLAPADGLRPALRHSLIRDTNHRQGTVLLSRDREEIISNQIGWGENP